MCRALMILCAAPDRERLLELKRASVSATWDLTGGARSVEELGRQVADRRPDVVVIDAVLGPQAVEVVRAAHPAARVISVGALPGADAWAAEPAGVRAAILGMPKPGGPVRG